MTSVAFHKQTLLINMIRARQNEVDKSQPTRPPSWSVMTIMAWLAVCSLITFAAKKCREWELNIACGCQPCRPNPPPSLPRGRLCIAGYLNANRWKLKLAGARECQDNSKINKYIKGECGRHWVCTAALAGHETERKDIIKVYLPA